MNWEDYFIFEPQDSIRIKGTRIWLYNVIMAFHEGDSTSEKLRDYFGCLSIEQIEACLRYYDLHKQQIDDYIKGLQEHAEKMRVAQRAELAPLIERMRLLAESRKTQVVDLSCGNS